MEPLLSDRERGEIKNLVRLFVADFPRAAQDEDDLEAEAILHWLAVRGSYDPSRGIPIEGYLRSTVRWRLRNLYDKWHGTKRRGGGEIVLELDEHLAEVIPGEEEVEGKGIERMMIAEAMSKMPPEERAVCRLLAGGATRAEARRALGISRARFARLLARIRERFSTGQAKKSKK